jgi:hypothetical protein
LEIDYQLRLKVGMGGAGGNCSWMEVGLRDEFRTETGAYIKMGFGSSWY